MDIGKAVRFRLGIALLLMVAAGGILVWDRSVADDSMRIAQVIPKSLGGEGSRGLGACKGGRTSGAALPQAAAPRGSVIELAPGVRVLSVRFAEVTLPCGEHHPGTEIELSNGEVLRFPGMAKVTAAATRLTYCFLPWEPSDCEGATRPG